jgi:hypothetical protein
MERLTPSSPDEEHFNYSSFPKAALAWHGSSKRLQSATNSHNPGVNKVINRSLLLFLFLSLTVVPEVANAQLPTNAKVWASGLKGPRGLKFGVDGFLM